MASSSSDPVVNSDSNNDREPHEALRNTDIKTVVDNYLANNNQHSTAIVSLLNSIKRAIDLERFIKEMVNTLTNKVVRDKILHAVVDHIKNHPWQIAFFVAGIVLLCNPLALAGFGASGPVAGSLAAAWQASIGNVAAGSLFAALQSFGMVFPALLPAVGAGITGVTAISTVAGARAAAAAAATAVGNEVRIVFMGIKSVFGGMEDVGALGGMQQFGTRFATRQAPGGAIEGDDNDE